MFWCIRIRTLHYGYRCHIENTGFIPTTYSVIDYMFLLLPTYLNGNLNPEYLTAISVSTSSSSHATFKLFQKKHLYKQLLLHIAIQKSDVSTLHCSQNKQHTVAESCYTIPK